MDLMLNIARRITHTTEMIFKNPHTVGRYTISTILLHLCYPLSFDAILNTDIYQLNLESRSKNTYNRCLLFL